MLEGMSRTDYYHDPSAPPANSLVPSTTAAVRDDAGRLLLIHKIDNDFWALPGGGMEIGESIADAAVREVAEETGLTVELTGMVGIYTDPGHVMAYDDGEVRQEFSVCFHAACSTASHERTGRRPRRSGGSSPPTWPACRSTRPCAAASMMHSPGGRRLRSCRRPASVAGCG
jgi:ADP-ribose pyrophosphatase